MNYTPPEPTDFIAKVILLPGHETREMKFEGYTEAQLRSEVERIRRETMEECVALRAEVEAFDKAEDSWMRKAIELESQMQGLSNEINDFQNTIERQKREIDALKADNLDLRSDEALNEAEALIRQAGAALLPHKSTVLRWYTPVDAALDAIEEYFK